MKTIKKILFPTDFSETAQNAFRYCLRVADTLEADIILLHVIYPEYQAMDIPIMAAKAMQDKAAAAELVLQDFVALGLTQVQTGYEFRVIPNIHAEVMIGNPVTVIRDITERDAMDMVIMGTRAQHNAFDKTFGSVTTGVLGRATCPVWVVPGEAEFGEIDVVAYATELNEADSFHIWKASQLLEPFRPVLHCVHVSQSAPTDVQMSDLELFFAQQAPALQVQFHNIEGAAVVDALSDFADLHNVDVLVMYAPHHSFWQRIFLQSTTRQMVLQTKIPTLFYKE
ncbi:MAG TPA: universal stress protein [Saprospiraceae bacterium]|nr:universal stress protein [Saprospiraceae bacterium]HMP23101.1 universal stress protein [Saprospiraceae bacterium]